MPPIPGYDMQRFIGRGGMGVVFQAVHRVTGRTVALKLINPISASDPQARSRFDREVRTLAALKHPNIVPVYDAGDWHGFSYYAMEFVPGGALNEHLKRISADLRGAVRLMAKVARAVAAMHAAGILHRDLKPLNILLGPDDEPMIADFGLVRRTDDESELTYTGQAIGTRVYMAPEQILGTSAGHTPACDIWAFGVTLYELLTGSRPFDDGPSAYLHARIRSAALPQIETQFPTVTADLAAVIQKCLQKLPEDRYATASAVADDLECWLRGEPVSVSLVPEPAPEAAPTPKPAKRPRLRTRILIAVATLLAAGVGAIIAYSGAPRTVTGETPPPPKSLVERVAAGEKVKLTDEKGRPLEPLVLTKGHELAEGPIDDYHGFFSPRWTFSMAALADERWEQPIRVEGDVGVFLSGAGDTSAGIYVGRRMWPGTDPAYESFIYCGLTPRSESKADKNVLTCSNGACLWLGEHRVEDMSFFPEYLPWPADEKAAGLWFTHVVIDVHLNEIRMTGSDVSLKPLTEEYTLKRFRINAQQNPILRQFACAAPAFGTGIGVFCKNTECVVANLTVSKLDP